MLNRFINFPMCPCLLFMHPKLLWKILNLFINLISMSLLFLAVRACSESTSIHFVVVVVGVWDILRKLDVIFNKTGMH